MSCEFKGSVERPAAGASNRKFMPFAAGCRLRAAQALTLVGGNIMNRRTFLHLSVGAASSPAISRVARAQAWPTRPITIIVPFAAGGGTDALARIVAARIRGSLSQPVITENVVGATGSIGVGRVVRAAGDGYTLSIGTVSTHVLTGALYALPYDLLKDLTPI